MPNNVYGAATTLQSILARKSQEKRQALLDSLNQQNVQSEIAARDENAKSMAEQRQALSEKNALSMADSAGLTPDEDISNRFDPSVLGVLKKYGRVKSSVDSPTPTVTTTESFDDGSQGTPATSVGTPLPPKTGTFYRGSSEDIQRARVKHNVGDFLEAFRQNPNMSPTERLLGISQAMEEKAPAAALSQTLEPVPNQWIMDADSGNITKANIPPGDHIITRSRTPQGFAPSFQFSGIDPKTNLPVRMDARTGAFSVAPILDAQGKPTKGGMGPKPTTASAQKPDKFPPAEINAMKMALAAYQKAHESGDGEAEAQQNLVSTQAGFIQNHVTKPSARAYIQAILANPNHQKYSIEDHLKANQGQPFDPQDEQQMRDVLPVLFGRFQ